MTEKVIIIWLTLRTVVVLSLTGVVLLALFFLLTELNDPNPNAALTALLGAAVASLGQSLIIMVQSIAQFVGGGQSGSNDSSEE